MHAAVSQPPTLEVALLAAEHSLNAEEHSADELRSIEHRLVVLLQGVRQKLRTLPGGECSPEGSVTRDKALLLPWGSPTAETEVGTTLPDGLSEWYSDPWSGSSPVNSTPSYVMRCPSGRRFDLSPISPDDAIEPRRLLAQAYTVDSGENSQLLAGMSASPEAAAAGDDLRVNHHPPPQWQYACCVASKLVSLSPAGCDAFEQLLTVLLIIFGFPEAQRYEVMDLRPKGRHTSWYGSRCF